MGDTSGRIVDAQRRLKDACESLRRTIGALTPRIEAALSGFEGLTELDVSELAAADIESCRDQLFAAVQADAPDAYAQLKYDMHGRLVNEALGLQVAAQHQQTDGSVLPLPHIAPAPRAGLGPIRQAAIVGVEGLLLEEIQTVLEKTLAAEQVLTATTLEEGRGLISDLPGSAVLVVVNLSLPSADGRALHGLELAHDTRRRRIPTLVVTGAGDYFDYMGQLAAAGLTPHDILIKAPDLPSRLRDRVRELVEPKRSSLIFHQTAGHVYDIGGVRVEDLTPQEAAVLASLDEDWRSPNAVIESMEELRPLSESAFQKVISDLRRHIQNELVRAESHFAQNDVIQSRTTTGGTQYRIAPWLALEVNEDEYLPPADRAAIRLLIVEDAAIWADWIAEQLRLFAWPAIVAMNVSEAREHLARDQESDWLLVADLGLPTPEEGLALIEAFSDAIGHRVVVLSVHGHRDTVLQRLVHAGVRVMDVIDKSSGYQTCRARLHQTIYRLFSGYQHGVQLTRIQQRVHTIDYRESLAELLVDRCSVSLSNMQKQLVEELMLTPNLPQVAHGLYVRIWDLADESCDPPNPLNRLQQLVSRLRKRIDEAAGAGVGAEVLVTVSAGPGDASSYELRGVVTLSD